MTSYLVLFKSDQKIIFDLGNLVNDVYTAPFNVTLTAAYFSAADSISPADLIVPISARKSVDNMPSAFQVPPNIASTDLTLSRNIKRAVFTIAATGQGEEEFWWSNVLQSDINTFPQYPLYGYSPFREVQLYIDGMLAGVTLPFPIIFTGGVVPGLWRPIVGIDAFDLKEDEIDITPWLPLLCDGKSHNFAIRISGLIDNGNGIAMLSEVTGSYWLVTGKVFIWLDEEGHATTGDGPYRETPAPSVEVSSSIISNSNGTNGTLVYQVDVQRNLSIYSTIQLKHGTEAALWRQSLSYFNLGNFSDGADMEKTEQRIRGSDLSSSGYSREYDYPLYVESTYSELADNFTIEATVNLTKGVSTCGQPVFPHGLESILAAEAMQGRYARSRLLTSQNGKATYLANQTSQKSFSFGTTEQDFGLYGVYMDTPEDMESRIVPAGDRALFHRYAKAVNGTVTQDEETLLDRQIGHAAGPHSPGRGEELLLSSVPGRGSKLRELVAPHARPKGRRTL